MEMSDRKAYRAKVDSVFPPSARSRFEQLDSCFLGVSLVNKNFTPEKLKAVIEWVSRRFRYCAVLVGDSIHRITLETTKSLEPDIALMEALEMGRAFIQDNEHLFYAFQEQTQFTFETCSQIQTSENYIQFYKLLQTCFESNASFRSSVEEFSRKYYRRKSNDRDQALIKYKIVQSCEYFLEEFAVFACLNKRGYSVMVYPGAFSTLIEIVNGEYPGLFDEIKTLTLASLHFKTRSKMPTNVEKY